MMVMLLLMRTMVVMTYNDHGDCHGFIHFRVCRLYRFQDVNALFGLVPVQGHACLGVARCTKSRPVFMQRYFVATAFPWETVP